VRLRSSRESSTHCTPGTRLRSVGCLPAGCGASAERRVWLVVVCLSVCFALSGCSGGNAPPAPTPPSRPAQPAAAPAPAPAPAPTAASYVYEAKGRRDPFRPLITPKVATVRSRPKTGLGALEVNELKLAGIVWGQRGYFALVEAPNGAGYVLRPNDTVGEDARVAKITVDGVTFEVAGDGSAPQSRVRVVELRLKKEE